MLSRILRTLGLVAAAVVVALAAAETARAADAGAPPPPPQVPACIQVATSSRWIPYGYNHVVDLANGCSKAATCQVSTDVNPERRTVRLASGEKASVVTFLGSPSATFTARVDCRLDAP
jgi:hypothetical protein